MCVKFKIEKGVAAIRGCFGSHAERSNALQPPVTYIGSQIV